MTNLLAGDNVLAAELHVMDPTPQHVAFGCSVGYVRALVSETMLRVNRSNGVTRISWDGRGFTLQECDVLPNEDLWTDVPGPVRTSPYSVTNNGISKFYRLR